MPRVLLPCLLAAVLLAGGCGDDAAPASERAERTAPAEPRPSRTPDASPSATPSPSPSSSPKKDRGLDKGGEKMDPSSLPVARPGGARSHLLPAGRVPAVDERAWTEQATGPENGRPVGACQRTALVDLGALRAVVRAYSGPEGSGLRSQQVVARFADPKSAWRAHQVLRAWRDDCDEVLDDPSEVGPMRRVPLESGRAGHYRADHGPEKDTDHTGLGIVRQGPWLSVVDIRAVAGSDFPSSWTRRAVRRIAATW